MNADVSVPPYVPPFIPPDCIFWLKGESLGLAEDERISVWSDDSGNGQNAIQDFASKEPTCQVVSFAGKSFHVARFDTVDDGMSTSVSINSPFSIFVMWRPADLSVTSAVISSGNPDWHIGTDSGQLLCFCNGTTVQAAVNTTDFFLVELRLTPGQANAWGYINGVQTDIIAGGGTSAPGAVALGSGGNGLGLPGGCDLAELLMYNRLVTDDEAAGIRADFQARYNYLKL